MQLLTSRKHFSHFFPLRGRKKITFRHFSPTAHSVYLVGDFNKWKTDFCRLKKSKNGWWGIDLYLLPGRYEYRYFVDGEWECAADSKECVPNVYGTWNCVLEIPAAKK